MSGQDLINDIMREMETLSSACIELRKRGEKKAQAEYEYRVALAEKILEERANSTPVTIISDICRGDRNIAKLKLDRDIAETLYETCMEGINATKVRLRIKENQIEREYRG